MVSPAYVSQRKVDKTNGGDFYPTPEWATKSLLYFEDFDGSVLEPACGNGLISKVIENEGYEVDSYDLYDRGYGKVGYDFLQRTERCDNLVTNPPFNLANEFLVNALKITKRKVCLFVRLAYLEGTKRYKIYSENPPLRVLVFSKRVTLVHEGKSQKSSGALAFCWMVWDNSIDNKTTELLWIPPSLYEKPTGEALYVPNAEIQTLSDFHD